MKLQKFECKHIWWINGLFWNEILTIYNSFKLSQNCLKNSQDFVNLKSLKPLRPISRNISFGKLNFAIRWIKHLSGG